MGKLNLSQKKPLTNGEKPNAQPAAESKPSVGEPDECTPEGNDNSPVSSLEKSLEKLTEPPQEALKQEKGGDLPGVLLPEDGNASPDETDQGEEPAAPPEDAIDHGGKGNYNLPGLVLPEDDDDASGEVELTEDFAADRFVQHLGARFRHDHEAGCWYHWTGSRWKRMKTGLVHHQARLQLRALRCGSARMATKRAVDGVVGLVARDPLIAVTSEIWDANPRQIGTPTGTINLTSGELLEADPGDYISLQTSVAPAAKGAAHPVFTYYLNDATGGDAGVQRLLQQFGGYSLTGLTNEQMLLFIYGPGGNGKSLLQNVFKEILGDYATTAAMETFTASNQQRHLTELAMLKGARFVGVSETEKGRKWAEARINQFTGGDPITANFMRQDHFTFVPKFKLMIVGNHKPNLSTVNDAARRRFIIVPFMHKPDKPDHKLPDKLRAEYPAILRWMIEGCLDWQANGLVIPEVVKATTADYFEEQDLFARWVAEKCDTGPDLKASASKLYASWKEFCEENGEYAGSSKTFGQTLVERGFMKTKSSGTVYLGIALMCISKLNYSNDI